MPDEEKKSSDNDIEQWLRDVLPLHERLSSIVAATLEASVKRRGIEFLNIAQRAKSQDHALEKIRRKEYANPKEQLTDLSGIRIITYLEEHARQISEVIKRLFEVDEVNSLDRSKTLALDKIGYRSTHFVCTLGAARDTLEEYRGLGALKFEIQVRTVLQHAWAELAHDRSYKFGLELPAKIQRRLNLYSGMLEVVDGAFDEIATEIDRYGDEIKSKTALQIAENDIDSISLEQFAAELAKSLKIEIDPYMADSVYSEMRKFGLRTIGDIERLITPDYLEAQAKHPVDGMNMAGMLRRLMMFSDIKKFAKTKPSFTGLAPDTYRLLREKYSGERIKEAFKNSRVRSFPNN